MFSKPIFWTGGDAYFQLMIQMINQSMFEIHLQSYIFDYDETGKQILNALVSAAKRGVNVYLVIDAYGSSDFISDAQNILKSSNINVKVFSPSFFKDFGYAGRRLHHKILCCDKRHSLVGGINISNKYKGNNVSKPWLDYGLSFSNEVSKDVASFCKMIFDNVFAVRYKKNNKEFINQDSIMLQNDWLRGKNEIFNFYLREITRAKKEIIIVGAYFLPGLRIRKALKNAANRGVNVKLLLTGISDVPLVRNATRFFYSFLLRHHIHVYEWKESVLHGKVMICDQQVLTVGSFNLNHLSQYGSLELNIASNNIETVYLAHQVLLINIKDSEQIKKENIVNPILRLNLFISFYLIRFMMIIATLKPFFRKKSKKKKVKSRLQ
jgi:cardiolipin synthase